MKLKALAALGLAGLGLALTACGGTGAAASGGTNSVTVYSADGLGDWYKSQFEAFKKDTGISVNYVEGGSGEVVSRAEKEKSNPQVDVMVTLPPFIQQADQKGLLADSGVSTAGIAKDNVAFDGKYVTLVDNYFTMIRNKKLAAKPTTWDDLLSPSYAKKIQYSTPGQAGDGTALLVLLQQEMGKQGALEYLGKLQGNNVGPSASTGKLGPKVSTGELSAANSDLQMAQAAIIDDNMNYEVFFPTNKGKRATIALPYVMGLGADAPNADGGKKLMEYLLAKDVQQNIPADAYGLPARSDVKPTGDHYAKMEAALKGVDVIRPDWDSVLKNLNSDIDAYNSATGQ